jgi:hypothetical protein
MPAGQNFPDGSLVVAFNPTVVATIQDRTLQRVFRDSLFPRLLFRMEAVAELWGANLGTNQTFTRSGLIRPNTRPLRAGQDPSPKTWKVEQWEATAQQWGDSIDNHMPTNYTTLASQYLRNMHQLGLQAGQSLNRVVRDKLYNSYVAGNTVVTASASSSATTIIIANGNGFAFSLDPSTGRPGSISAANPVAISIPSIAYTGVATGFAPTVAGEFIHGGTLTISPGLTANIAARASVLAGNRSVLFYSGGGTSVDDIVASDQFSLRDVRAAVAQLRFNNIPTHEDGLYHWHLDPFSEAQLFGDNEMQRLNQSLPDYVHYRRFAAGVLLGSVFYRNNETPYLTTCDDDPTVGATHAFETVNAGGVNIHRPICTGLGAIEEKYLDEGKFISEAGVTGKIGEFAVTNMGVQVMTERIRLVLRAPLDRLQQLNSSSWSISGDWPTPTDALAPGGTAAYRRAAVVVHGE